MFRDPKSVTNREQCNDHHQKATKEKAITPCRSHPWLDHSHHAQSQPQGTTQAFPYRPNRFHPLSPTMKQSNLKKLLDKYLFIQQENEIKSLNGIWEVFHSKTHKVSYLAFEHDGKTPVANLGSIFISSHEAIKQGGTAWANDRVITDRLKTVEQHLIETKHLTAPEIAAKQ